MWKSHVIPTSPDLQAVQYSVQMLIIAWHPIDCCKLFDCKLLILKILKKEVQTYDIHFGAFKHAAYGAE